MNNPSTRNDAPAALSRQEVALTDGAETGLDSMEGFSPARTSRVFLGRFALLWTGVAALVLIATFRVDEVRTSIAAGTTFAGLASYLAVHFGRIDLARFLFVGSLTLVVTASPFVFSGMQSPVLMGMSVTLMLSAWMFGRRTMLALAIIFGVDLTCLWYLQATGLLQPRLPETWLILWWQTDVTVIVLSAITIWHLVKSFEALHNRLTVLGLRLKEANLALSSRLQTSDANLHQVRAEYEKAYPMAMLAAVVPAIAHDLNTPIGNANMAANTLRERLTDFREQLAAGKLRKSELDHLLAQLADGLGIIERAGMRAADLVVNLKQLSIDQASARRREFLVAELVDEVATMLAPTLKKGPWTLERKISDGLKMDSYPGPLGQVLVNLLQNSVVHAFDGRESGVLTVAAEADDAEGVIIRVIDNGHGMSEETLSSVFDPFFTTKLGSGGSGVGLTYSQRIVTKTLGGEIKVSSRLGEGTEFVLHLPRSAPQVAEAD